MRRVLRACAQRYSVNQWGVFIWPPVVDVDRVRRVQWINSFKCRATKSEMSQCSQFLFQKRLGTACNDKISRIWARRACLILNPFRVLEPDETLALPLGPPDLQGRVQLFNSGFNLKRPEQLPALELWRHKAFHAQHNGNLSFCVSTCHHPMLSGEYPLSKGRHNLQHSHLKGKDNIHEFISIQDPSQIHLYVL